MVRLRSKKEKPATNAIRGCVTSVIGGRAGGRGREGEKRKEDGAKSLTLDTLEVTPKYVGEIGRAVLHIQEASL